MKKKPAKPARATSAKRPVAVAVVVVPLSKKLTYRAQGQRFLRGVRDYIKKRLA